jgi:glutathione S-transferase
MTGGAADSFVLHGSAASQFTYKVGLMLSLSGQGFSFRYVNFAKGAHKSPEFLALNRFGQAPVLQHGTLNLCQSGAILEYLAARLDRFDGSGAADRQRVREWLFWAADRLSPNVYRCQGYARGLFQRHPGATASDPAVARHFFEAAEAGLGVLAAALAEREFLIGAMPTIADVACYGDVAFCGEGGLDRATWPSIEAWRARIESLPGFAPPYELLAMEDKEVAATSAR